MTARSTGQPDQIARWSGEDLSLEMLGELPTDSMIQSAPLYASGDGSVLLGDTFYSNAPQRDEAWIWTQSAGRLLIPAPAGSFSTIPSAISGDGRHVTGYGLSQDGLGIFLFVWTPEQGTRTLVQFLTDSGVNLTGWSLGGTLSGISFDGTRLVTTGTRAGGRPEAVLITIPAPAGAVWVGVGGLALIRRRRLTSAGGV